VLASFAGRCQVTLEEVRGHAHGAMFPAAETPRAGPPSDGAGRFDLAPADVVAEIATLAERIGSPREERLLLAVRRQKHVLNSTGTQIPSLLRVRANPCFVHPDDLERLGLADGDKVSVSTAHGSVDAVTSADRSLRPGVVTLTHGFGGPSADGPPSGPSVNAILSATTDLQAISAMPLLSAVPVTLARRD
jgi:anaerobic selenocysteine-containing dehydrogenase